MSNSNTPRTDAALEWVRPVEQNDAAPPNEQYVNAEFAREMERKLADAHDNNRIIQADNLDLTNQLIEVRAENSRLKKEHRAMSKGAQTNAKVVEIQARKINEMGAEIEELKSERDDLLARFVQERDAAERRLRVYLDAEDPQCGWPALVKYLRKQIAELKESMPEADIFNPSNAQSCGAPERQREASPPKGK